MRSGQEKLEVPSTSLDEALADASSPLIQLLENVRLHVAVIGSELMW